MEFEMQNVTNTAEKENTTDQVSTPKAGVTKDAEKPVFTKEELNKVFDEIMFEGSYTEQVKLREGKLIVKFKSRTAKEINAITEKLDAMQANLLATISDKRSFLNLSDALIEYQGTDLTRMDAKSKAEFMDRLPAMIVFMLVNAMVKFDSKVYEACKEGEENF